MRIQKQGVRGVRRKTMRLTINSIGYEGRDNLSFIIPFDTL